jgi:apolipoprotein N-acyltransferase
MKFINSQKPWVLAVLSGLLMALSFPEIGNLNLIMGIAWVPLLLMESKLHNAKRAGLKIFALAYLAFVIYNVHTSYWIYYSDPTASILAFLANSLLMAIAFWLFYFTKKHVGAKQGYIGFVFFWLAFEYQHYNWELSHPWLTLGNVFANAPELVQWYEWTGALGGSLWLLVINLLVFGLVQLKASGEAINLRQVRTFWIVLAVWLVLPMLYSLIRYSTYKEQSDPIEVVVSQPNLDAYIEKFGPEMLGPLQQLDSVFIPIQSLITQSTRIVLAPETAIPFEFNESSFALGHRDHDYIMQNMQEWPNSDLLIGASTFKYFNTKRSVASRAASDGRYYESFNTSILMSKGKDPEFVHKSKLVLGVERIPFLAQLPILEKFSMQMGGAYGTLGVEDKAIVLESKGFRFAPLVCYESIYGDWVAEFVRNGAQVLFIITNDGWWRDTPGYRQHFAFARLRAVETRRSIARSANTGSSGFINQRGDVLQKSDYDVQLAMRETINLNDEITPYVLYGDMIGRISYLAAILIMILAGVRFLRRFGKHTPYGGRS